jgi:hypothetical protein
MAYSSSILLAAASLYPVALHPHQELLQRVSLVALVLALPLAL